MGSLKGGCSTENKSAHSCVGFSSFCQGQNHWLHAHGDNESLKPSSES